MGNSIHNTFSSLIDPIFTCMRVAGKISTGRSIILSVYKMCFCQFFNGVSNLIYFFNLQRLFCSKKQVINVVWWLSGIQRNRKYLNRVMFVIFRLAFTMNICFICLNCTINEYCVIMCKCFGCFARKERRCISNIRGENFKENILKILMCPFDFLTIISI